MNAKTLLIGASLAATIASGAHAGILTISYDVTASNFINFLDPGTGTPPVDPVIEDFTVSFDPSVSTGPTSVGLNISSFNLPYSSEFTYAPGPGDVLTVATYPGIDEFTDLTDSYGVFVYSPLQSTSGGYFVYTDSTGTLWYTNDTNITSTSAVPEPSTWAMILLGFAGLGFAGRHWQRKGTVAA